MKANAPKFLSSPYLHIFAKKFRINEFYPNGYDATVDAKEMKNIYNIKAQAAEEYKSSDKTKGRQLHIDAALEVCEALIAKGDAYENIINSILNNFGIDVYNQDCFNNVEPNIIADIVNQILDKAILIISTVRLFGCNLLS